MEFQVKPEAPKSQETENQNGRNWSWLPYQKNVNVRYLNHTILALAGICFSTNPCS